MNRLIIFVLLLVNVALCRRNILNPLPEKFQIELEDGTSFTGSEFNTLLPRQWLHGTILDYTVQNIIDVNNKLIEHENQEYVFITTTTTQTTMICPGFHRRSGKINKVDFVNKKLIIPYHDRGFHWCLIIADTKEKTFEYYDPMVPNFVKCVGYDPLERLFESFLNMLKKRNRFVSTEEQIIDVNDWKIVDTQSVKLKKQTPNDCGIYVIMFIDALINNGKPTFNFNGYAYRNGIMRAIIERSKVDLPINLRPIKRGKVTEPLY